MKNATHWHKSYKSQEIHLKTDKNVQKYGSNIKSHNISNSAKIQGQFFEPVNVWEIIVHYDLIYKA